MKRTLVWLVAATIAFSVSSCKKNSLDGAEEIELGDKAAPDGFDYSTTKKVEVSVRLLTRTDQPVGGVLVSFYDPDNVSEGAEIAKALSDKDGYVRTTVVVPSYLDNIVIDPAYIGLLRNAKAVISGSTLSVIIGGKNGYSGNIVFDNVLSSVSYKSLGSVSAGATVYDYDINKYDELGRPKNLEAVDNFDFTDLLKQINTSLPERVNGVELHPEYLATSAPTNLTITKLSDVWITFVHEGANYRNTLGYYKYPTNNPPAKASDIDSIHIILPNASLKGGTGAGNMLLGDKVKIGRFAVGTSIGFVLIQNAYGANGVVSTGNTKFYSTEEFNPESSSSNVSIRRHNVLLHNSSLKIFLVGFEDIRRDQSSCDNDFNDLVFYAQSNPVDAISPENIPYLEDRVEDTDGDGVPDVIDEYPNDPARVYNRYYPSKTIWGTLAFEDKWPSEGDYDLNDLVVSYRYKFVINKDNKVVDLVTELKPKAAGAIFQNGFGIEFPFQPAAVSSVTGQKLTAQLTTMATNGVEAGQSKAVIIPFDNHRTLFNSSAEYINTTGNVKIDADTVRVSLAFTTPQTDSFTGSVPFNPFMFSNSTRGNEIHLPGATPTNLADLTIFSKGKYKIDVANAKYYITTENKPFAMNFMIDFKYPLERVAIGEAYTHFAEWASSGGTMFKDWYEDKSGYINKAKVYSK